MFRTSFLVPLLLSIVSIAISSCSPGTASPSLSPPATDTPRQTATTAVTATPTITPTQAFTPTLSAVMLTFTKNAFCRNGPSTQYFDKGSFDLGATAQALGRNDESPRWWYMLMENGDHCWVSESTVGPNPAAESFPVQLPEKALPQTPSDFSIIVRVCKPTGFAITLGWTASSNADGYYVYRDGEQIQDIGKPTQTSYINKAPMNQPVSYALEAYNNIGNGERVVVEDPRAVRDDGGRMIGLGCC